MQAFFTGFFIGFGLILAIGAQNAFVLRQGIKGEFVGPIVAFCAISDAILIFLGVYGAGALIIAFPKLGFWMTWLGVGFLIAYGMKRFEAAYRGEYMEDMTSKSAGSLKMALMACAGFTYLNPHVYLDTWVVMGSLSLPYQGEDKMIFAIGASLASLVFFTALGYGARLLRPIFQNQTAWRVLDVMIGVMMFVFAIGLMWDQ